MVTPGGTTGNKVDGDGVGDDCALATCGNGMLGYDEQCDLAQVSACDSGSCNFTNCT